MDEPTPKTAPRATDQQPQPPQAPTDWLDPSASAADQAASITKLLADDPQWLIPTAPADGGSRATRVHGQAPANVAAISDLADQASEIHAFLTGLAATPPRPAAAVSASSWYAEAQGIAQHTGDPAIQAELDALAWRHATQAAIRIGDYRPITHTLCPGCSTWGLRWLPAMVPSSTGTANLIVCLNRRCRDADGARATYTLHRLATLRTQRSSPHAAAN